MALRRRRCYSKSVLLAYSWGERCPQFVLRLKVKITRVTTRTCTRRSSRRKARTRHRHRHSHTRRAFISASCSSCAA